MRPQDAKRWFGTTPPDLSVIARAKSTNAGPSGADYIYTYLRTFYRDTARATGWNNLVFPHVGMPPVLWELQGPRELTTEAMHEVEGTAGAHSLKRVTTTYVTPGYATAQPEPCAQFQGPATGARTETRR